MARIEEEFACRVAADRQAVTSVSGGVLVGFSQLWPMHL
jgi:hypothetical protein